MTITYLVAYFFTPTIFQFDIPILNITFAKFVEITWIRMFLLLISILIRNEFFFSFCRMYIGSHQYSSYSRVCRAFQ